MEAIDQGNLSSLAVIAAFLPLLSFLGILLFPTGKGKGGAFAISMISLSLAISIFLFASLWNTPALHQQYHWFTIGTSVFNAGIFLNNLSVLMLLLVSSIALLVHIYSTRYMRGDPYLHRYWAYLGLFCFSMLGLVITDNLFMLYMFWELVGFSSYLLIGFWFTKDTATQASKKAFIMNRLGDLGFLIGIMIVYSQFGTLEIPALFEHGGLVAKSIVEDGLWINGEGNMPAIWLTVAGLAFFFGACAKSAQFPLHTWLPDAMEGPTAVSSLIHAATMVAAGVFLLARIYPLFDPIVLNTIACIGAFTAFMAATIALTQNDIKRILAFSTISQLGFMMLAMGVGAYASGIFHLATHAFFKCLLFLAAGAVIHEMAHLKEKTNTDFDHQDIGNMGGLRKGMPITFITMVVASLALVGLPLTSGYLSKDAILIQSFEWADLQSDWAKIIPYSALLTSWLTAFYISRLIFKVFFGELRINELPGLKLKPHEAPAAMKYVLMILAVMCFFPAFSFNPLNYEASWLLHGLASVREAGASSVYHTVVPVVVNLVSLLVLCYTYVKYSKGNPSAVFTGYIQRFSERQWYLNEIYKALFVNGTVQFAKLAYRWDKMVVDGFVNLLGNTGVVLSHVAHWADKFIVDGIVNGAASLAKTTGNFTRKFQTGRLQHYLFSMMLIVLTFFLIKYFGLAI